MESVAKEWRNGQRNADRWRGWGPYQRTELKVLRRKDERTDPDVDPARELPPEDCDPDADPDPIAGTIARVPDPPRAASPAPGAQSAPPLPTGTRSLVVVPRRAGPAGAAEPGGVGQPGVVVAAASGVGGTAGAPADPEPCGPRGRRLWRGRACLTATAETKGVSRLANALGADQGNGE
jgi:hypothetical protein